VRNLFDGAVEAVLEGEGAQVESVLNRLRQGPPMSRVEHVSTLDEPATGEFTDFDITYSAGDWRL
jgi:acylphosphatase